MSTSREVPDFQARWRPEKRWAINRLGFTMREYDVVRVIRLSEPDRHYTGSEGVSRPPKIGDIATICHEYEPSDPNAIVAVEMVASSGATIWLADFARDELESVSRPQ